MTQKATESAEFERLKSAWEKSGITVYSDTQKLREIFPLKGYIPDLILQEGEYFTAVEILSGKHFPSNFRIRQIEDAISRLPNWTFLVHHIGDEEEKSQLRTASKDRILSSLQECEILASENHTRSSLLLAWSTLEASARLLHPKVFNKPHTPATLIAKLAERGHINPDDADSLRSIAALRNQVVHGDLERLVRPQQVIKVTEICRKLLALKLVE